MATFIRMLLVAAMSVLLVAGCGGGPSTNPGEDTNVMDNGNTPDSGPDLGPDAVGEDTNRPDVVDLDNVNPPDGAEELPPDDAIDSKDDDATIDVEPDVQVDAPGDVMEDTVPEVPADVEQELPGEDVQEDTAADIVPEVGTDTNVPTCAVNHGGCSADARCTDDPAGAICQCKAGFEGDGYSCTDVDECPQVWATVCDSNAWCHNLPGSFECICNDGYSGSGASCSDINECAALSPPCGVDAWCTNNPGSYQCQCLKGSTILGNACQWAFQKEGFGKDSIKGIAVDFWASTYALMSVEGYASSTPAIGGKDIAIVKYDYLGAKEWTRMLGSSGNDLPGAITVDRNGNVYVTGLAMASIDAVTFNGWADVFVAKYDKNGVREWLLMLGTAAYEYGTGIAVYDDSVYVSGYTNGVWPDQTNAGMTDAFLARIDMGGSVKWYRQFGTSADDHATVVAATSTGTIFVGGTTEGSIEEDFDVGFIDGFVTAFNDAGDQVWVRQFGSFNYEDVSAITTNTDGDVMVAGTTSGVLPGQTGLGMSDAYAAAFNIAGDPLWTSQFGTDQADFGKGIVSDDDGIWVSGSTDGLIEGTPGLGGTDAVLFRLNNSGAHVDSLVAGTDQFDEAVALGRASFDGTLRVGVDTMGDVTGHGHTGDSDAVVLGLDATNNIAWFGQTGSRVWTVGSRIVLDQDDVAYVMGSTRGNIYGDVQPTVGADVFLARVQSNGNVDWLRQHGTGYDEIAAGIALGPDGVVMVGHSAGLPDGSASERNTEVFLAKYTLTGTPGDKVAWGTTQAEKAGDAAGDDIGNIYVVGNTYGEMEGTSKGGADMFVAAFYPDLTLNWVHQFGTSMNDELRAVAVHPEGGVVATGRVLTPIEGVASGSDSTDSGGVVVVRYDADGNQIWLRTLGAEFSDLGTGVAVDIDGDVYITGVAYRMIADTYEGMTDIFVMRLAGEDGSVIWARQFGTAGYDEGHGIAIAPGGDVFVTGVVVGALSNTVISTPEQGGKEGVVIKMSSSGTDDSSWLIASGLDDSGEGIAIDSMGNRVIVGTTQGSVDEKSAGGMESMFMMKR